MPTQGPRGRFIKGGSPGPGRPKGLTENTKIRQQLREGEIKQLLETIVRQALDGCLPSQKLLADRLWPAYQARDAELLEAIEELRERVDTLTALRRVG